MRTRGLVYTIIGAALALVAAWCAWLGLAGFMGYPTLVMTYGLAGLAPWAVVPTGDGARELLVDWPSMTENILDPAAFVPLVAFFVCVAAATYGIRTLRTASSGV